MRTRTRTQADLIATRNSANRIGRQAVISPGPLNRPQTRDEFHTGTWVRGADGHLTWVRNG